MEGKALVLSWRPCVGATAEYNLGQGTTPRHRLAVSFPHRARCFKHSLVRLSPCADKWNRQGRAGGRKAKDVDGTLETAGGKIRARQSAQPKATRAACKQGKVGAGSI